MLPWLRLRASSPCQHADRAGNRAQDLTVILSPWKEKLFNLIAINLYSGYEFAFPVHSASTTATTQGYNSLA